MLSERRQRILNLVVGAYLESGKPVSSAAIADDPAVEWGPSTVRAELAALEHEGYLGHPHTSAGRVPTDSGYRFYADALVSAEARPGPASGLLDLSQMRREIEQALQETTATLSRMTDLLAIATAPPPSAARIHRVEVLQLQPGAVMVVVIASNGAVTKRMFNFASPVDPGLGRVGIELPQRAPRRARARRPDDLRPTRRPRARAGGAPVPGRARATPSPGSSTRPRATSTSREPRGCSRPTTPPTCPGPTR